MLHLRYDFEINEFCDTVGQRLRFYRQLKGYSTRQLADMVSVVPAMITLYENDNRPIKYKTAVSIAEVLEINRTLLLDDYIGIWGQRHLRYLKQHHKILYTNLLTIGKLNSHLAEIDQQATDMCFRLVKQLAEKEGVMENLKAENQME